MEEVRTLSESLKEYGVEPPVGFPYVSEKDMKDSHWFLALSSS